MRRRDFIALLGGATVALPLAARAQQAPKTYRIGFLASQTATDPDAQRRGRAFSEALEHLGWTDGGNFQIDYRWAAGDTDRARVLAKELVSLAPDVILATSSLAFAAVRQQTQTIPIVFVAVTDPVGQGFVASLAHPGGNITGFSAYDPAMGSKWLELLKEVAPGVARVAVMFNPETSPYNASVLRTIEAAASSFAVKLSVALVHDTPDIEGAIAALAREPNGGLILAPDAFTLLHRELIISLAAQHRLPAVYPLLDFATNGGLIVYGIDFVEQHRQAAVYIHRILKGAKPGDLPVQAPTKFELAVNLKAARALGLTVPPSLLARADEVIE